MMYMYGVVNTIVVYITLWEWVFDGILMNGCYWMVVIITCEMPLHGHILCYDVCDIFHLKVKYVRKVRNYDNDLMRCNCIKLYCVILEYE